MWDYIEGGLDEVDRIGIGYHLRGCRDCELHYEETRSLRKGLRKLPVPQIPPMVNMRLKVIASRERSRQVVRRDLQSWVSDQISRIRLTIDNLLRPLAVPAAGGILASSICFGAIMNNLHVHPEWDNDVPIGVSSDVDFAEVSPFTAGSQDIKVLLSLDAEGNVTDFSIPQTPKFTPDEIQQIGNLVLYSAFTPAIRDG
ncbi:MAG: zf-HC2 domain-containing protein, partial [Acidobacteriota bacterium]|nr:zf-HC2 domain-containing protein [Acidobacteriota bacterium]